MKIKSKQAKELKELAVAVAEALDEDVKKIQKKLTKELGVIVKRPFFKKLSDEKKVENGLKMLRAPYVNVITRSGRPFEAIVLDFTKPRKGTTKEGKAYVASDLFLLVTCTEEEANTKEKELRYSKTTLWGEDADQVKSLERGEAYEVELGGQLEGNSWNLRALEGRTRFKKMKGGMDVDVDEILTTLFNLVPIVDAEFNLSSGRSDLKLVRGTVTYSSVHTSEKGFEYGRYVIVDDSMDVEDIKRLNGLSIMVDKSQVIWAVGSELFFLGPIDKSDKGQLGMNAGPVIPIYPIPLNTQEVEETEDEEDEEDDDVDEEEEIDIGGEEEEDDDEDNTPQESEDDEDDDPDDEEEEEEEEPKPKPKKSKKKSGKKSKKSKPKKEEDDDEDDEDVIELDDDE